MNISNENSKQSYEPKYHRNAESVIYLIYITLSKENTLYRPVYTEKNAGCTILCPCIRRVHKINALFQTLKSYAWAVTLRVESSLRLKPTELCDGNYHRNKNNSILIEWHDIPSSKIIAG